MQVEQYWAPAAAAPPAASGNRRWSSGWRWSSPLSRALRHRPHCLRTVLPAMALPRVPGLRGGSWGLHSFTSQLNLSAFYGIRGARRGCIARVKGVLGLFRVCRVLLFARHGSS